MSEATARIRVQVTPRAARSELLGWRDGVLRLRVTAPPVEGRANEAVVRLLSAALGVPRSRVAVVSGMSGRQKLVQVEGLGEQEVRRRLA